MINKTFFTMFAFKIDRKGKARKMKYYRKTCEF